MQKRRLVIYRSKKGKYPISLILISVLTSISYLISNYLALYPPDNMLTFANIYFFFILPVFLWYSLDSRKYMIYCLQLLSGCNLFACVYSIIEVLFNKNIIQDVLLMLRVCTSKGKFIMPSAMPPTGVACCKICNASWKH